MVLKISGLIHKILNRHMDIVQNVKEARRSQIRLPPIQNGIIGEVEQASPAASLTNNFTDPKFTKKTFPKSSI